MAMTVSQFQNILEKLNPDTEVRIGDVVEGSNFHCTVGVVELRNASLVITPGSDLIWKDEHAASAQLSKQLWPDVDEEEKPGR